MIRETGVKHRSGNKCVQGQMYSMKPGNRPFIELRLQDTEVYQGLLVLVNRDHPVRHQEQQTEKLPGIFCGPCMLRNRIFHWRERVSISWPL